MDVRSELHTPHSRSARLSQTIATRFPPQAFFLSSAVFHYLGPSFAVLLFPRVAVLGVVWLRIASAGAVFAVWRRPWRIIGGLTSSQLRLLLGLGAVLAIMNACFYLAIDRLPLSTVGAIEFLGPVALATLGARTVRNLGALGLAAGGAFLLTEIRLAGHPLGFAFAFANCLLFTAYIVLGHRVAEEGGVTGVDRLGLSMLVALVVITPFGIWGALPTVGAPLLLGAGVGVGVCSSVIPYVCDQLAMARLPRPTFALMLSLLPASATVIGLIVLHQVPRVTDVLGIGLVIAGIALHHEASTLPQTSPQAKLAS
jgi:inner membrane transporter RhtA